MFKNNYVEGEKIGNLVFVKRVESEPKIPMALFVCGCGKQFIARIQSAKTGKTRSCGCLQKQIASAAKKNYEEGQLINSLIFLKRTEIKNEKSYALFRCGCGEEFETRIENVKNGRTKSCGCMTGKLMSKARTKHGHSPDGKPSSEYKSWQAMWRRVTDPKHQNYQRYKELGVTICDEWKSFENFIADMGVKPNPKMTIDRIENDKGYYKENCRWATPKQQQDNRRDTVYIEYLGQRKSIEEWSKETGINRATIYSRIKIYKWSVEKTLTTKQDYYI